MKHTSPTTVGAEWLKPTMTLVNDSIYYTEAVSIMNYLIAKHNMHRTTMQIALGFENKYIHVNDSP